MLLQETNRFNMHVIDKLMDNGREHKRQKKIIMRAQARELNQLIWSTFQLNTTQQNGKERNCQKDPKLYILQLDEKI